VVTGARNFGEYEIGDIAYLGCEFVVEVSAA
jgi:hypothetical protein